MAYDFSGTGDIDYGSNTFEFPHIITFSWWMLIDAHGGGAFNANHWAVYETGTTNSMGGSLGWDQSSTNMPLYFYHKNPSNNGAWDWYNGIANATEYTNGDYQSWQHFCITYDSTSTSNRPALYRDGSSFQLANQRTAPGAANTGTSQSASLMLGRRQNDDGSMNGKLAEFAIYSKLLSTAEISALANGAPSWAVAQSNLVAYAPLDGHPNNLFMPGYTVNTGAVLFDDHPEIYKAYVNNDPVQYLLIAVSPNITSLSDTTLQVGDSLTINGENFGDTQGTSTVDIGGVLQTVATWSDTQITITTVDISGIPNGSAYVRVDVN